MKSINLAYYAVALFLPILIFTVFTDNTNEKHPVAVFLVCIVLFGGAGLLASQGVTPKNKVTWLAASVAAGIAEACLLAFAF